MLRERGVESTARYRKKRVKRASTRTTTKIYGEMQCPIVHSGEEQRKNYGGRATDDLAKVEEELTGEGGGAAREVLVPMVAG